MGIGLISGEGASGSGFSSEKDGVGDAGEPPQPKKVRSLELSGVAGGLGLTVLSCLFDRWESSSVSMRCGGVCLLENSGIVDAACSASLLCHGPVVSEALRSVSLVKRV